MGLGTMTKDTSAPKPTLIISKGKPKERLQKAKESMKQVNWANNMESWSHLVGAVANMLLFLALGLTSSLIIDHIDTYGDPRRCACFNKNCQNIDCPDMDVLPEVGTIFTAAILYSTMVILHAM